MLCAGALDLIIDEELAADDKENDNARENIRNAFVEAEIRCNLACAPLEENYEERGEYHKDGIEFCKPGYHYGCEAVSSGKGF